MDIKQLKYFLKVYEKRSFSKAAEDLFITQQGVSKAIQQLEKELGVSLFTRTNQGLTPTKAGENLEKHTLPYLIQWENIQANISHHSEISEHTLRIGFDLGMMELTPRAFFSSYLKEHPSEDIRIYNYTNESREKLLQGQLDVAFCYSAIDAELFDEILSIYKPITLAVHAEHPLGKKESITIADLKGYRLVDLNQHSPSQEYYRECCRREGIEPSIILNGSQGAQLAHYVSENIAVSFFAGDAGWLPPHIRLIPFSDLHISFGYHMIVKKGRYRNQLLQDFIESYRDYLNQ